MLRYAITSFSITPIRLLQRDDDKKQKFLFQHLLRLLRRGHGKKYRK